MFLDVTSIFKINCMLHHMVPSTKQKYKTKTRAHEWQFRNLVFSFFTLTLPDVWRSHWVACCLLDWHLSLKIARFVETGVLHVWMCRRILSFCLARFCLGVVCLEGEIDCLNISATENWFAEIDSLPYVRSTMFIVVVFGRNLPVGFEDRGRCFFRCFGEWLTPSPPRSKWLNV